MEQPRAGVDVQYLSPVSLGYRQWDGYSPPPSKEFPNQWHVEASTRDKQQELAMVTVLVPYRVGKKPEWSAERMDEEGCFRSARHPRRKGLHGVHSEGRKPRRRTRPRNRTRHITMNGSSTMR